MSVKRELKAIDEAIEESLNVARKHEEKRTAKSRREVYQKALKEVQDVAGDTAMAELSGWIQARIREDKSPPAGRSVRKQGARICREYGEEISTGSWLGA